ncbi:MAG: hypothetical protein C0616_07185 [Desulfuromonas sp.]|nr:MAG: hypothetical protein C0616_07185 [Desulfuromonas sp.]
MDGNMREQIQKSARTPLQRPAAGELVREFLFSESFIGFAGHFPGFSILPAVGQMLLAQSMIEEDRQRSLTLRRVENAKFTRPIRPGEVVRVEVSLVEQGTSLRAEVAIAAAGATAGRFRQVFLLEEM